MLSDRLKKLEKKLALPGQAPVVIIKPGDPVPPGVQVVIYDNIPRHGKIHLASGKISEW